MLLCLLDTIDWPTAFLGAIKAGMVPVPVNTLLTEDDYRFMLEDSRARLLVVSEELYPKFAKALAESVEPPHVIVCGANTHGHAQFEALLAGAARDPLTAPTVCDDMCFWLYTSGSTGKPKAAVAHARRSETDRRRDLYGRPYLEIGEDDICFSVAKLFAVRLWAQQCAHPFPMCGGCDHGTVGAAADARSVGDIFEEARRHRVLRGPDILCRLAGECGGAGSAREVKIRCCVSAGEALPVDVGRRFRERYGVDILDGIGSTEMLHIFISNRAGDVKYGTTGKPVPGYDVRLVDDDGHVVEAQGEMGELQVRGPTSAVMYWNNREQSRSTFLGEWTRSGDKYLKDEQGYFVYCGRRDDMLKVGGIYVSPFEVEAALQSHPEVLEAAVVGWPDADALIKPKAFVVLKSPDQAGEALKLALQDHCREKLAAFKYPRWLEFRAELPKTATGKIQRFKLRAEAPGH